MRNTNNIQEFIDRVLEGLSLSELEKKAVTGVYLIKYYQSLLECLLGAYLDDENFSKNMLEFFAKATASLSEEKRKNIEETMDEEKIKLLADLVADLEKELPVDQSEKIKKNLETLSEI